MSSPQRRRIVVTPRAFTGLIVAIFIAIGGAGAAGGLALKLLHDAQRNRVETYELFCDRLNRVAIGQRRFVARIAPRFVGVARRNFPVERNCRVFAERTVKPPTP